MFGLTDLPPEILRQIVKEYITSSELWNGTMALDSLCCISFRPPSVPHRDDGRWQKVVIDRRSTLPPLSSTCHTIRSYVLALRLRSVDLCGAPGYKGDGAIGLKINFYYERHFIPTYRFSGMDVLPYLQILRFDESFFDHSGLRRHRRGGIEDGFTIMINLVGGREQGHLTITDNSPCELRAYLVDGCDHVPIQARLKSLRECISADMKIATVFHPGIGQRLFTKSFFPCLNRSISQFQRELIKATH
ncbi:hypothetical protein ANO11243_019160 [Dothideomycetidae sp. 11243]|nr:hypothetical protein ANO11243_019160 [fungal sp. No.11243]